MSEGTGLSVTDLLLILTLSLALFLFWNGPLWSASDGTSHFGRIFLSYAIVIPCAAAALALRRAWSWGRLATITGLLWAIKLIVTSLLFVVLASGAAQHYDPAVANDRPATIKRPNKYTAAIDPTGLTAIRGSVLEHGQLVSGALVFLGNPAPGRALDPPKEIEIDISQAKYARLIYAGSIRDFLRVHNHDAQLHTLSLKRSDALRAHVPIPAMSKAQRIELPREPGTYEVACENHDSERALLALFDHPYFALTREEGTFEILDAPHGSTSLWIQLYGAQSREFKISSTGSENGLSLELSEDKQR
jgi:hypothetical protein